MMQYVLLIAALSVASFLFSLFFTGFFVYSMTPLESIFWGLPRKWQEKFPRYMNKSLDKYMKRKVR